MAVGTPRFPSPTNFVLPVPTGQVIAFSRRPDRFRLNKFCQYVQSPGPEGIFHTLDRDQPIRVTSKEEFAWADGDRAPDGNTNLSNFKVTNFRCERFALPFTIGEETVDAAKKLGGFDPVSWESMQVASQMMVHREIEAMALIDTTGTWTGFTGTATALGGGKWDVGTSTTPFFRKGILQMAANIIKNTNGAVQINDLVLVLQPDDAIKISSSPEIFDYLKGSPYALPTLVDGLSEVAMNYGMPPFYHGIKIVVDDTVKVTANQLAAGTDATRTYAKASDQAVMLTFQGGQDGTYGTKMYSTIQMFYYKYEMAVESQSDYWNKRISGRVVDYRKMVITSAATGYEATDVIT